MYEKQKRKNGTKADAQLRVNVYNTKKEKRKKEKISEIKGKRKSISSSK